VEVLNAVCEERRKSLLSLTLEEILTVDAVIKTAAITVIGDKMDRVSEY